MLVPGRAHVVLNSRGQQEINCHPAKACADWDLTLRLLGKDFMNVPLTILSCGWKPCLFQHGLYFRGVRGVCGENTYL